MRGKSPGSSEADSYDVSLTRKSFEITMLYRQRRL